jgi:hypothetical protein
MGGIHCGQNLTLEDFPSSNASLVLASKQIILADFNDNNEPAKLVLFTIALTAVVGFAISSLSYAFAFGMSLITGLILVFNLLFFANKGWIVKERSIVRKQNLWDKLLTFRSKKKPLYHINADAVEYILIVLTKGVGNSLNDLKTDYFALIGETAELLNTEIYSDFDMIDAKAIASRIKQLSQSYKVLVFSQFWHEGFYVEYALGKETNLPVEINKLSLIGYLSKYELPFKFDFTTEEKVYFTTESIIRSSGILHLGAIRSEFKFLSGLCRLTESDLTLRDEEAEQIFPKSEIRKIIFEIKSNGFFVEIITVSGETDRQFRFTDNFQYADMRRSALQGFANFSREQSVELEVVIPSSFVSIRSFWNIVQGQA